MERHILNTYLTIHPEFFSSDKLYPHILDRLKQIEMTCSFQYGYIDQIFCIINIIDPKLLDNGYCKFNIFFEANCFKPEIDKEIETTVEMIFQHGIFSSLHILRFLIPSSQLHDYDFLMNENAYKHKSTNQYIRIGDKIRIRIMNLKYENDHFSCIGKLI